MKPQMKKIKESQHSFSPNREYQKSDKITHFHCIFILLFRETIILCYAMLSHFSRVQLCVTP